MEAILTNEGLPTSLLIVGWSNGGLTASGEINLEICVPGKIVETTMTLDDHSDPAGPWDLSHDPRRENADPALVRIKQAKLMPKSFSQLIVGYQRMDTLTQPTVRVYVGDKTIRVSSLVPLT